MIKKSLAGLLFLVGCSFLAQAEPLISREIYKPQSIHWELARLKDRGFAVIPGRTVLAEGLKERLIVQTQAFNRDKSQINYLVSNQTGDIGIKPDGRGRIKPDGRGGVKELESRVSRLFHKTLPDEKFNQGTGKNQMGISVRFTKGSIPINHRVHVDQTYLTATISLIGPGTVIYEPEKDGRWRVWQIATNDLALFSGVRRKSIVPPTLHSAPPQSVNKRIMIGIGFLPVPSIPDSKLKSFIPKNLAVVKVLENLLRRFPRSR